MIWSLCMTTPVYFLHWFKFKGGKHAPVHHTLPILLFTRKKKNLLKKIRVRSFSEDGVHLDHGYHQYDFYDEVDEYHGYHEKHGSLVIHKHAKQK